MEFFNNNYIHDTRRNNIYYKSIISLIINILQIDHQSTTLAAAMISRCDNILHHMMNIITYEYFVVIRTFAAYQRIAMTPQLQACDVGGIDIYSQPSTISYWNTWRKPLLILRNHTLSPYLYFCGESLTAFDCRASKAISESPSPFLATSVRIKMFNWP